VRCDGKTYGEGVKVKCANEGVKTTCANAPRTQAWRIVVRARIPLHSAVHLAPSRFAVEKQHGNGVKCDGGLPWNSDSVRPLVIPKTAN
jgi:hypothetical protein